MVPSLSVEWKLCRCGADETSTSPTDVRDQDFRTLAKLPGTNLGSLLLFELDTALFGRGLRLHGLRLRTSKGSEGIELDQT